MIAPPAIIDKGSNIFYKEIWLYESMLIMNKLWPFH